MAINAKGLLNNANQQLQLVAGTWSFFPGSIEKGLSMVAMRRYSGLFAAILFVGDLARRPLWRRRLWISIGLTGTSLTLFGLVERILRAPMIFWETDRTSHTFFATYLYHANAGAFINLVLPLIAGLAFAARAQGTPAQLRLAVWGSATLLVFASAFVNFSRGAQAISVFLLVILAVWQLYENISRRRSGRWGITASIALLTCALVPVALLGWTSTSARWTAFPQDLSTDGRHFAARVTLRMAADAGALGFGPGTFRIGFPFYENESEISKSQEVWRYAHEDYLQTYVEWGWLGSAFWIGLFGGGLSIGLNAYWQDYRKLRSADRILVFTSSLSLIGIALHAIVDFPLQIASLQLYTSVLLGLGWTCRNWTSADSSMTT